MTMTKTIDRQPHPALELFGRYRAILHAAWAARHELAGPARQADELAFLPAALSLQKTPAHPAPQRAAWAICALFAASLAWSYLGQIDIIAVASGRIVVSERTKTLQPLETGVVKRVFVKDGDIVQAGQILVELDATNASADGASVQEQLSVSLSEALRAAALLHALRTGKAPEIASPGNAAGGGQSAFQRQQTIAQLQAEWQDITAKLGKLSAEQARRHAEITTVQAAVEKIEATLPLSRQREADFRRLTDEGFVSGHAGEDRRRERIEQERDLAMQRARLAEAQAASVETANARHAYLAETQRALSERQALATSKREQLVQESSKAAQRTRLTHLTAPVAGTVQQLAVHTEGGVVTPAQALLVIVPADAKVTAEVVVDNKDIGFVNSGQPVAVKLETFPFTRYGTVDASVSSVSADAVNDEKRGAIFPATLAFSRDGIVVDGKRIRLSPGMNVTAEIKTGRRRVIDYLLSPVQTALSQSLRER